MFGPTFTEDAAEMSVLDFSTGGDADVHSDMLSLSPPRASDPGHFAETGTLSESASIFR